MDAETTTAAAVCVSGTVDTATVEAGTAEAGIVDGGMSAEANSGARTANVKNSLRIFNSYRSGRLSPVTVTVTLETAGRVTTVRLSAA